MGSEQPEHHVHYSNGAPDEAAPRDSAARAEPGAGHKSMQHAEHGRSVAAAAVADSHSAHVADAHAAKGHAGHNRVMGEHAGHDPMARADHTGHEAMFRQRIWVSLLLSIPVLLYSPTLQALLRFTLPAFPGGNWIEPL